MEQQQSPKLTIVKNQPITIRLKSSQPFYESEHPKFGKSYGFNVLVKEDDPKDVKGFKYVEYVWWAKDAARNILKAAHIHREEDFKLELKSGLTKDNKPFTIWLIDDKSTNDWMNTPPPTKEEFKEQIENAINDNSVAEVVGDVYDLETLTSKVEAIEKRLDKLEDDKDADGVPF